MLRKGDLIASDTQFTQIRHVPLLIYIYVQKEEFEDTKGVMRIRKSTKNRQHNGKKKKAQKDKQRSTKHAHKTKDRVTRTPLKIGSKLRCSGRVSIFCSTSGTRRVNLVTNPVTSHK